MQAMIYPRLILLLVAFTWVIALSAQSRFEARLASAGMSDTTLVPIQLAGLPRPGAAPGQRIFFTVQEDVFVGDSLLIAAGARAKGWIRTIRHTDTALYMAVEMEAVQTVEGEMAGLEAVKHTFRITLNEPGDQYISLNARLSGIPIFPTS